MRVPLHTTAVDPRTLFSPAALLEIPEAVPQNLESQSHRTVPEVPELSAPCVRLFGAHQDVPLDHSIASACASPHLGAAENLPFVPTDNPLAPALEPITGRRVSRKMGLIRRAGLFGEDTKGARISRAATFADLRDAYKLVHRIYLGTGYISEEQAAMRLRIFETSAHTATFIAKKDGRVVGVLTIVPDTAEFGLPSDTSFRDVLNPLRARGMKLCETTNQAVSEDFRNSAVPTELMRCALAHSIEMGYDAGVAAISPSHRSFHELLRFHEIGGQRSYSDKIHDPVVLVQIDLDQHRRQQHLDDPVDRFMHAYLTAENPYFLYVGAWEKIARERFQDAELLRQLFLEERDFLGECSEQQLAALREHWGRELFSAVTGTRFAAMLPQIEPDIEELTAPHAGEFSVHRMAVENPVAREVDLSVARDRCVDHLGLPAAILSRVSVEPALPGPAREDAGILSMLRGLAARARTPMVQCPQFRNLMMGQWRSSSRHPATGNC